MVTVHGHMLPMKTQSEEEAAALFPSCSWTFAATIHPGERGSYLPRVYAPDLCRAAMRNGWRAGEQPR